MNQKKYTPGAGWPGAVIKSVAVMVLCGLWCISPELQAINLLDPNQGAEFTLIDNEANNSSRAAANLIDNDFSSRWESSVFHIGNDFIFRFGNPEPVKCFNDFSLTGVGGTPSIRRFMLLTTQDLSLDQDKGAAGWLPVIADPAPTGIINHLHWGQGGRLTSLTGSKPEALNDGSARSSWISNNFALNNQLDFAFDTDWNGSTGNAVQISELRLNSKANTTALKKFQVEVKTLSNPNWTRLVANANPVGDFNFLQADEGGILTSSTGTNAALIHDGTARVGWTSNNFVFESVLAFEFDTDNDGITSAAGDNDDLFRLRQINLYNKSNILALKKFQLEVKTLGNPNWTQLVSNASPVGDFNFLQRTEGGVLTASTGNNPNFIHDGSPGSGWRSNIFSYDNLLEFAFDTDNDGTTGAAGDSDDLFTLRKINLYNKTNTAAVKTFQIEVKTVTNPFWTLVSFAGSSTLTAQKTGTVQIYTADAPIVDVTAVRLHTLTNYGFSWVEIQELEVIGDAIGPSHTFIAQQTSAIQSYVLPSAIVNVTSLRLRTLDNYGYSQTAILELEAVGDPIGPSHTFEAQQISTLQTFPLTPAINDVTDVRLHTLDNFGHSQIFVQEFGVAGIRTAPSYVFTALDNQNLQQFNFSDSSARLFRFHVFDNYGFSSVSARGIALESTQCLSGNWFMDEALWNGTPGEVVDQSGSGNNGTASGGATTANNAQAIPGNPGTCGYGHFDGSSASVQIPHAENLNGDQALTYTAWVKANDWSGIRQIMAKSVFNGGSGAAQMGIFSENGLLKGRAETDNGTVEISSALPSTGSWHHLALTFSTSRLQLFVDGLLVNSQDFASTSTLIATTDPLIIGKQTGVNQHYFDGDIDEVRVYQQTLTAAEIKAVRVATHPCVSALDHFFIQQDGQGISCAAEPVTVSAHAIDHSVVTSYTGTIVLNTNSGKGSWNLVAGNGVFVDVTANDGLANYSFDATDNGVVQFSLNYSEGVSPINISVSDSGIVDDDTEGLLFFAPSGFVITNSPLSNPPPNPVNDPLPTQIAGSNFNLSITAFGQTPSNPQCGVIESYTGIKPINFWSNYSNPTTGTRTPTVNAQAIAATEVASTPQNIPFTNGQALVLAKYKDVGAIQIALKDADLSAHSNIIQGASNNFVVKPADFITTVAGNPAAANASGAVFKKAGAAFTVQVDVQDAEGDLTPNYGNETVAETLKVKSSQLIAPVGGRNGADGAGTLGNNSAFVSVVPGQFENITTNFSEVGIIRLQTEVGDGDYLGAGNVVGTETANVGRFIPDRFQISSNNPFFRNGDSSWGCGFSYQSQPFEFATGLNPQLTLTALSETGSPTFNYAASFWKLTTNLSHRVYVNQVAGISAVLTNDKTSATVSMTGINDFSDGQGLLTIEGDQLTYVKAATIPSANDAPFDADVKLSIPVSDLTDSDGVCVDGDNDGVCETYNSTSMSGTQLRWGRWFIENALGSELENLDLLATAEYFDGAVFQLNSDDICSANIPGWIPPILSAYTDNLAPGETLLSQGAMSSGLLPLVLSAPGEGNDGSVILTMPTPAWMFYDYEGNGTAESVSATATFGIYKGKKPVIYWRQKFGN